MTAPIRSMPELVAALRARRDELQLTHETIDAIAGWPSGYAGKLLAPEPIKNLGWMSLGAALDTLGIALVVVENKEQRELVESRWKQRERPKNGTALASRFSMANEVSMQIEITPEFQAQMQRKEYMRMIGKRGGQKGGKRRLKTMGKRRRQAIAAHAARMRWSKRASA